MTSTNANQINWFLTAATLRAAFTQEKRQDGTLYWCLTEQARQSVDDLTEWLRGLHDDEMPNDWRYETIVSILDALMDVEGLDDYDYHDDLVQGISDNITDIYNGALLQWYADIPSRVAYIDDAQSEGLIDTNTDTIARLTIGQGECIRYMCHRIIDRLITQK
tara:strand:+ start:141 stop:629 length:489 start_codon:yes stop_codon:yes gene_type:complete